MDVATVVSTRSIVRLEQKEKSALSDYVLARLAECTTAGCFHVSYLEVQGGICLVQLQFHPEEEEPGSRAKAVHTALVLESLSKDQYPMLLLQQKGHTSSAFDLRSLSSFERSRCVYAQLHHQLALTPCKHAATQRVEEIKQLLLAVGHTMGPEKEKEFQQLLAVFDNPDQTLPKALKVPTTLSGPDQPTPNASSDSKQTGSEPLPGFANSKKH